VLFFLEGDSRNLKPDRDMYCDSPLPRTDIPFEKDCEPYPYHHAPENQAVKNSSRASKLKI
jgi:hypothetical protein